MFFVDVDVFLVYKFDKQRIDVLVGFVSVNMLRIFRTANPWVVVAADKVLDEVATVIPPEGWQEVAGFLVFVGYSFDWYWVFVLFYKSVCRRNSIHGEPPLGCDLSCNFCNHTRLFISCFICVFCQEHKEK